MSYGDGDGNTPSRSAYEVQPDDDGWAKSALHRLVLVLPLTILIFEQALLHPCNKIKLPVVELELEVHEVLPIFLMIISFMLYRALRYARIVLWSIFHLPQQTFRIVEIALDSAEAYKVNSAYYEEVLDPMAAAYSANLKSEAVRSASVVALAGLNFVRSLVGYGLIFLLLGLMAFYVSRELPSVIASPDVDLFASRWATEPKAAIKILVLCLSALLLLLAWSNAACVILIALWEVARRAARLLIKWWASVYRTALFGPLRAVFRSAYHRATRARERHRDRVFAADEVAYHKRAADYRATSPEYAKYKMRYNLFKATNEIRYRVYLIEEYFGDGILGSRADEHSEWRRVNLNYYTVGLQLCAMHLGVFAQLAPVEFVSGDAQQLYDRLKQLVDSYDRPPDDGLLAIIRNARSLTDTERQQAAAQIRERLATIVPRLDEISELESECERKLVKIITGEESRYDHRVNIYELSRKADAYFRGPSLANAGFAENEPIRGARDWKVVTYLLDLLRRAAALPAGE